MSFFYNFSVFGKTSRRRPNGYRTRLAAQKIIFLILVTSIPYKLKAQDFSSWYFCFAKDTNLTRVKSYLGPYLLSKDKIYENIEDNCLQINLSENRKELFEKQLRKNFNLKQVYKDNNSMLVSEFSEQRGQCALEFTTKGKSNNQNTNGSVQMINGVLISAEKKESSSDSISSSQILVLSGKSASIQADGKNVFVTCDVKGQSQAELSFSLKNSENNGGSNSFSSSLLAIEGQELNIGSVITQLNNNDQKISLESGVNVNKNMGNQNLQYYIRLKKIIWN